MYGLRLDPGLVAAFDESAKRRKLSRANALERLMRRQVDADGIPVVRQPTPPRPADVEPRFKGKT